MLYTHNTISFYEISPKHWLVPTQHHNENILINVIFETF